MAKKPRLPGSSSASGGKLPKLECCVSKSKCGRCPLRMLKEGNLPDGMTVKKRKLVDAKDGKPVTKKQLKRVA